MDRPWLSQYPAGVPAEIDVDRYLSLKAVLADTCARYAHQPAYESMGTVLSFGNSPTNPVIARRSAADQHLS